MRNENQFHILFLFFFVILPNSFISMARLILKCRIALVILFYHLSVSLLEIYIR